METFCTAPRHSKYRPAINSNSFHHPSTCSRTYRQNEYGFINSTRSPAPGWHERPYTPANKSRGKFCSIALGASIVLVLVAVISIVGLAFHMGALRSDPTPLATYSCSIRLLKGDRFLSNLSVKARRYRVQFESLFQRSILGPSLVSCAVDKFGNDTLTIHLKLSLNRRKIPRHIHTIEKAIKDIILGDAHLRRPIFQNIKFDPNNLFVKQTNDGDTYQKTVTTFKERPKSNLGGQLKQPNKNNFTLTTVMPVKKPSIEEVVTKEEDLPVIQGSFKISKTEADIIQKKETETESQKAKAPSVTHHPLHGSTLKETYITSALFKLASGEKSNKTTNATTSTTKQPTASTQSPITSTYTIESSMVPNLKFPTTNTEPPSSILFSVSPSIFDQEPWVPIYSLPQDSDSPLKPIMVNHKPTYYSNQPQQEPVYTSFTNPGLSLHSFDTEKLGKNKLQGHPIPVNKISETTETLIWNNANIDFETTTKRDEYSTENHETKDSLTEVATIPHISASQENKNHNETVLGTDRNNVKLTKSEVLKNISSIFYSLASSLGLPSVYLDTFKQNTTEQPVDVQEIKESTTGQGQVEVIDVDEASLIMETTTAPLVTLLPAKSNSGVGRPIRPRPQTNNKTYSANRSFPNEATKLQATIKPPKEENMQIFGFLNFQTDLPSSPPTAAALIDNSDSLLNESFDFDSTHSSNQAGFKILSPEKIKQLSQISNLTTNRTRNESIFSTKALSSGYNSNEEEFKILTKTFNKAPNFSKAIDTKSSSKYNAFHLDVSNKTDCSNFTVKCGDGQCLPDTTRCNQLMDCNDGSDEKGCNCADYLRSQFLLRKICDGIVDCWDYSDENHCDWCSPGQYVCGNSKICINRTSICDGIRDCPLGDDERQCVTVAPNINAADEFPYYSEGYLMVRKRGTWGKLCVDNFKEVVEKSHTSWEISDLGQAVCKAMTYKSLDKVKIHTESKQKPIYKKSQYYELSYSIKHDNKTSLTFENSSCPSGYVVRVKCETLECGTRPQASKQLARIVGGGNAGLGAWPWQAALYKEGEFQCGATLVSEKWLLSAGHCFYHSQQDHWVVRLGALRRGTTFPSPYEQLRPIVQIILHPDYVDSGFLNDISLLRMETAVIFSDYVRPVCLPPPGVAPKHGRTCTVIGWGQLFEIGRIFPDTLQEVQVPVISTVECRKRTLFLPLYRVTDDMFCAGYDRGGRDACLGDSGGPLMCPESDGRWTLHGITSNGYGCARAYRPGVYTKVSNYIPWINSHIYSRDNSTTITKNSCAGHRCPLGECLPKSNLCNGFIECSDGSDEVGCLDTSN